jgi:transcriptional regulator with XRE-family HTH domain
VDKLEELRSRISEVVDRRGVASIAKALIESGAGKDLLVNMRKGQTPSVDKFKLLADYLDCSVDYLLGRTDVPEVNR